MRTKCKSSQVTNWHKCHLVEKLVKVSGRSAIARTDLKLEFKLIIVICLKYFSHSSVEISAN